MNIIPAIDLKDGNCVRLLKGDFAQETFYSSDPPSVADRYAAMGFTDLHVVDLDGARSGRQANRDVVRLIVESSGLSVQLGGGIRERDTVAAWFEAGVARVVIGSLAVVDPGRVAGWMQDFGADRFVLALDCRVAGDGTPWLATHGWTRESRVSLWDSVEGFAPAGLRHVLCTDVERDGALAGPSLALYREFRRRFPDIALQASGGVRGIDDLYALRDLGAAAAITGRAVLDGRISKNEVASFRRSA